jgi:hypothetical protein
MTMLLAGAVVAASAVGTGVVDPVGGFAPMVQHPAPTGMARVLTCLHPLDGAVATTLPVTTLVAWDIGAGPAELVAATVPFLDSAAPHVVESVVLQVELMEASVGRGAVAQLLEALGSSTSLAVLPPEATSDGWPLPRPVWLFLGADVTTARAHLDGIVPWLAGAIAPATRGVYGGAVLRRRVGSVDLTTVRLDSLIPGPLPRPTVGITDDAVLISSTDSGVLEVVAALSRPIVAAPHDAVELFRVDPVGLSEALMEADARVFDRLERWPTVRWWWRVLIGSLDIWSSLGPISGVTTVSEHGHLHLEIECEPPLLASRASTNGSRWYRHGR